MKIKQRRVFWWILSSFGSHFILETNTGVPKENSKSNHQIEKIQVNVQFLLGMRKITLINFPRLAYYLLHAAPTCVCVYIFSCCTCRICWLYLSFGIICFYWGLLFFLWVSFHFFNPCFHSYRNLMLIWTIKILIFLVLGIKVLIFTGSFLGF